MTRIIPLILAVALLMETMDATVIATSLPAIAADIGTSPTALKLAFTAYFVSLATFIPISAWLADRFGAKNVFRGAIVVFMLGSVGCAFADSLAGFVVARFLQGMGGAMMTPLARLILVRTTPRSELVNAMAWLTIPALIGPTLGPPLGGFITTFLSWHWIFLINVPTGLIGLVLITRFLPHIAPSPPRPMDFPGFLLTALAFSGTVFGASVLSLPVLPSWAAIGSIAVGIAAGAIYVRYALSIPYPLLDPRLFKEPSYRAAVVGTTSYLIGMGALPFLLPLMLQVGFGYTPFQSGLMTGVGAIGSMLMKFLARPVYAAVGFRMALMTMALCSAATFLAFGTFQPDTPVPVMLLVILIAGMFRSIYFTGQNALAFADIEEEDSGPAAAVHAVMRPIGMALGVAVAGGVIELSASLRGAELGVPDFHNAFYTISTFALLAAVPFILLSREAGSAVSGHRTPEQRAVALAKGRSHGTEGGSPRS